MNEVTYVVEWDPIQKQYKTWVTDGDLEKLRKNSAIVIIDVKPPRRLEASTP